MFSQKLEAIRADNNIIHYAKFNECTVQLGARAFDATHYVQSNREEVISITQATKVSQVHLLTTWFSFRELNSMK